MTKQEGNQENKSNQKAKNDVSPDASDSIVNVSDSTSAGKQIAVSDQNDEDQQPFDFGGLPNRDLKKNLGCG